MLNAKGKKTAQRPSPRENRGRARRYKGTRETPNRGPGKQTDQGGQEPLQSRETGRPTTPSTQGRPGGRVHNRRRAAMNKKKGAKRAPKAAHKPRREGPRESRGPERQEPQPGGAKGGDREARRKSADWPERRETERESERGATHTHTHTHTHLDKKKMP